MTELMKLAETAERYGELSDFFDVIFGKSERTFLTIDEDLGKLRSLIDTKDIILKNLVAKLMLRFFVENLLFQELEYLLGSSFCQDVRVVAAKALIHLHGKSLNIKTLYNLIALDDKNVIRDIHLYY